MNPVTFDTTASPEMTTASGQSSETGPSFTGNIVGLLSRLTDQEPAAQYPHLRMRLQGNLPQSHSACPRSSATQRGQERPSLQSSRSYLAYLRHTFPREV